MNSFKLSFALAVVAVATQSFAQGPGGKPGMGGPPGGPGGMGRGPRMSPKERQENMLSGLGLSATQHKKAEKLIDEYVAKRKKLNPAGGRPPESMRPKFMAMQKEYEGKLKTILTPAQVKLLDKKRADMMARFRGMGGGRMGGPGGPGGRPGGPGGRPGGPGAPGGAAH